MKIVRLAVLGAAITLAAGLLAPATSAAATRSSALPATVSTRTVHVDVDGDKVLDRVRIVHLGGTSFEVRVRTATGKTDTATLTSTIVRDWGIEPWYGAARLDGVKGYELILLRGGGDGVRLKVFTWRSGHLVAEKAPKPRPSGSYVWYTTSLDWLRYGYRFSTVHGSRYVENFTLTKHGSHWSGTIVRSVWKAGTWTKLSTRHVNLSKSQAKPYSGISGVTVIARP